MVGDGDSTRHSILVHLRCKLWYGWVYGKGDVLLPYLPRVVWSLPQCKHRGKFWLEFRCQSIFKVQHEYTQLFYKNKKLSSPHDSNFEGALCLQNSSVRRVTLNTYFSWNSCPPLLWNNFIDEGHSSNSSPETYWLKTGINCPLPVYSRNTATVQPRKCDISGISSLHALPCEGQGQQRWWL